MSEGGREDPKRLNYFPNERDPALLDSVDEVLHRRLLAAKLTHGTVSVRSKSSIGSGVKVGDRFLTASHVVAAYFKDEWRPLTKYFDVGTGDTRFRCRMAACNSGYDLAVLDPVERDIAAKFPAFTVAKEPQHIGDPVWVGGYPYGAEVPVVRTGIISSIVIPQETAVVQQDIFMSKEAKYPAYWIDVPVFGGNSGGPVLNEKGELIGLAIETQLYPHKIQWSEPPGKEQPPVPPLSPVPVYMDIGMAVRLDIALPVSGINKMLSYDWEWPPKEEETNTDHPEQQGTE